MYTDAFRCENCSASPMRSQKGSVATSRGVSSPLDRPPGYLCDAKLLAPLHTLASCNSWRQRCRQAQRLQGWKNLLLFPLLLLGLLCAALSSHIHQQGSISLFWVLQHRRAGPDGRNESMDSSAAVSAINMHSCKLISERSQPSLHAQPNTAQPQRHNCTAVMPCLHVPGIFVGGQPGQWSKGGGRHSYFTRCSSSNPLWLQPRKPATL